MDKLGRIDLVRNLNGTLSETANIIGTLDGINNISGQVAVPKEIGYKEHERLTGRDKPNQHPIQAITDLPTSLENLQTIALTNQEIENLLT